MTIVVGISTLVLGAVIGYVARLTEFRRERRLVAYGEFIGAFLTAAHTGAALLSMYMRWGEATYRDHRDELANVWSTWGVAAQEFEGATARLFLIGSEACRTDAQTLEGFITSNVRQVPPLTRTEGLTRADAMSSWGTAAQTGPAKVDAEAVRLARLFADRAHGEITGLRRRRRERAALQ